MDLEMFLKNVISVDQQILKIYQNIIINEYLQKDNEKNIKYLKQLIELEKWAYQKLNLSYEQIGKIIDLLEIDSIPEVDLARNLLLNKIKSNNILEKQLKEQEITQLINYRIKIYLESIYYLDSKTPKNINYYPEGIEGINEIEKKDDKCDIYLTDSSYLPMRLMSEKQYIACALANHDVVLTFNTNLKKRLEMEAITDIEQLLIMLLELKSSLDGNNRYFYIEEIYYNIFKNKILEDRVISADFNFENLFEQFSTNQFSNENNKKFLNIYRQQISYISIYDYVNYLFSFEDNDFINYINGKYNIISFNIYIEYLKSYICVMRYDELVAIRDACYKIYKNIIANNKCAKMVYYCLSDEYYDRMQGLLNMDKKEKIKK